MLRNPIRVIPTGIEKEEFSVNGEFKHDCLLFFEQYTQLKNKKLLFTAGRLGKEKNIEFLIDVLQQLLHIHPDVMLVISGDGPVKKELEEYAAKKGVFDNIVFTGFIDRLKLKNVYSIANVFVFASKVESQGMVTLESMACGTPVVAIGKMGTREVMGGDFGGFMVDDDLNSFVERVDELLTNSVLHQLKSEEALSHVDKWTMDLQAVKMIRLYESLITKKQEQKMKPVC